MVSEAGDVQTFLAQHPPFNHLSENQLEYASDNIYVAFSKSGNELRLDATTEGVPAAGMLIVRSGSIEVRDKSRPEFGVITLIFARDASAPGGLRLTHWVALDSQNHRTTVRLRNHRYGMSVADGTFSFRDPRRSSRRPR